MDGIRQIYRRRLLTGIGLFAVGGAAGVGTALAAEATPTVTAEGPTARTATPRGTGAYETTVRFRTAPSDRIVALTIDDGPTQEWTPRLLAILRRHNAKATFFRVGERAKAAPDLVARTAEAGHEQGNHTWEHQDLTQHDLPADLDSLRRTHDLLTTLTGQAPRLCRPPYGRIDSVGLETCAALRYGVTLWSDGVTGSSAQSDVDRILTKCSPGSIYLAHDGGPQPNTTLMAQLDRLVGSMTDRGYEFVTVSELLARSTP